MSNIHRGEYMRKYNKSNFSKSEVITYKKKTIFYILSIIILFVLITILTSIKPNYRISSQVLRNMIKDIDSTSFLYVMGLEVHTLKDALPEDQKFNKLSNVIFQVMTDVQADNIHSLLGQEIPGLSSESNLFIVKSSGINYSNISFESSPPVKDIIEDREAIYEQDDHEWKEEEFHREDNEKVVFVYNSHNRESYLPHLPDVSDPRLAHHQEVNISKVSERFAHRLEKNGIGVVVDDTDHMQVLHEKEWNYGMSYQASREVIQETIAANDNIQYIFDIHRDALPRDKTTATIDGEEYSQILMIVGAEHENYERNLRFASELHDLIDEQFPGLSKGILIKEGAGSNGIYNQDIMDNALLFEIGGYENTLDESFRTADILADIFSEYYWEAEKVFLNE